MPIRRAREEDTPTLGYLVERAYSRYVQRIGRRPAPMDDDYEERVREGEVFVADEEGLLAGLIVLVPRGDHLRIENVAVEPDRQGRGVGRALLEHAEQYARERSLAEVRLYTNVAMVENLALYPRLGYTEVDRRSEDGFDRVFFAKPV